MSVGVVNTLEVVDITEERGNIPAGSEHFPVVVGVFLNAAHPFLQIVRDGKDHIDGSQQNTPDIDGYYYEGKDGSQICVWTYFAYRESTTRE